MALLQMACTPDDPFRAPFGACSDPESTFVAPDVAFDGTTGIDVGLEMPLFGLLGAFFGLLSVALGAFAAHGLRDTLSPEHLRVFETAARYQMYHALALVLVATLPVSRASNVAGWLFVAGTLIFSGSLYALAWSGLSWLGAITPLGGLCFLGGWVALAASFWRR